MGYEFFCSVPLAVGVAFALVIGASLAFSRFEDWLALQIEKNWPTKRRITQPTELTPQHPSISR